MPARLGERYGRLLTVAVTTSFIYRRQHHRRFVCICDCGEVTVARAKHLMNGAVKSCGCLHAEGPWKVTHGESIKRIRTPEYIAWGGMKQRCYNPGHDSYDRYGGRGIVVCARWLASYEDFLADMGRKPSPHHSIDRINNDGNYEPGNCRWATGVEQQANRGRGVAA